MKSKEWRFSEEQVAAFRDFSADLNPLHLDDDYSSRSIFGRRIVYGIAGVMAAISAWGKKEPFRFLRIEASFERPLLIGDAYVIQIDEKANQSAGTGGTVSLEVRKGKALHLRLSFEWSVSKKGEHPVSRHSAFIALSEAKDGREDWLKSGKLLFSAEWAEFESLAKAFELDATTLPWSEIEALASSSYLVGMICPGKQALFSSLEMQFNTSFGAGVGEDPLIWDQVTTEFDERFSRYEISLISERRQIQASLCAFRRPEPVQQQIEKGLLRTELPDLREKAILVTGASRGFGAALALVAGACGAKVIVHYHRNEAEAERVASEIRALGAHAEMLKADLSSSSGCGRLLEVLQGNGVLPDWVFLNPSPRIDRIGFLEQGESQFLGFVKESLDLTVQPLMVLTPMLKPGTRVIQVSSVATRVPHKFKGFSHYVAAKSAAEGLIRSLAVEFPKLRFAIIRPPRMLTDQTNSPFHGETPASATEVALRCIRQLAAGETSSPGKGQVEEVNFEA